MALEVSRPAAEQLVQEVVGVPDRMPRIGLETCLVDMEEVYRSMAATKRTMAIASTVSADVASAAQGIATCLPCTLLKIEGRVRGAA